MPSTSLVLAMTRAALSRKKAVSVGLFFYARFENVFTSFNLLEYEKGTSND